MTAKLIHCQDVQKSYALLIKVLHINNLIAMLKTIKKMIKYY